MLLITIGLLSGILSGLAVGGGTLLVPALVIFMGATQHLAQGICLTSFIPTAIVAIITHYRHKLVNVKLALYLTIGALPGALLGASLAHHVDAFWLKKIFGFFLICMGIYELFGKKKRRSL